MKEEIKGILFWLEGLIIFCVSFFFAIAIVGVAVISGGWIYMILAIPLVIISFFLSKKFPKRFTSWSWRGKTNFYKLISTPPVFTAVTSIALVVFIAHFFDPLAKEIWSMGLILLPGIMNEIGMRIFAWFVFLPVLVILCYLTFWGLLKILRKKGGIDSHKFLFYVTIAISTVFYAYLLGKLLDGSAGNEVMDYIGKAISIIVGCIPIHWAYEIFIGSIFKKIN